MYALSAVLLFKQPPNNRSNILGFSWTPVRKGREERITVWLMPRWPIHVMTWRPLSKCHSLQVSRTAAGSLTRTPALRIWGFDFSRLLGVYYYLAIVSGFEQPFSISDSQVSPSTLQTPSLFNELASLLCTQNGSMYCPLRNSEKLFTSFCLGLNSLLEPNWKRLAFGLCFGVSLYFISLGKQSSFT